MTESSSSGFIVPAGYSSEWRDITLAGERTHTRVYTATRYGRRFLLKTLPLADAGLTDRRLQQEREFLLGVRLVHPDIAATYSLEEVAGIGRCIVQEWIDGVTLGEWLETKPPKAARERVFSQVLDALEYLHGLQLVHHDLKADNILVTRNGANAKLIDFGLSALDSTLSPVPNDPLTDLQALRRLFPESVPAGRYANIASLRRAISRRRRFVRLLPAALSVILLLAAAALFLLARQERSAERQRQEEMCAVVDANMDYERRFIAELVSRTDSFDISDPAGLAAY